MTVLIDRSLFSVVKMCLAVCTLLSASCLLQGPFDQPPTVQGAGGARFAEGFPGSSVGEESACNEGDSGSIPGWGRSTGEG